MVDKTSSTRTARSRNEAWPLLAITLLAIQAVSLLFVKPGPSLSAYSSVIHIVYFLVLLLATAIATLNAIPSRETIRLFWSFFALGCGLRAVNAWAWVYYVAILGKEHPDWLLTGGPLYLHPVFLIAAVASRPHLKLSRVKPYRNTLNLLLLLFFCVFAYAIVLFPVSIAEYSLHIRRAQVLYSAANLLLLAVLGAAVIGARPPWKVIYWHFLGASALYALGSLAANLAVASGTMSAGWYTLPYTAAAYWLAWVCLQGRDLAPQLEQTVQVDTVNPKYLSTSAMLAVVAIPIVGLWELFRTDRPYTTHVIRLLIVFLALLFLAVTAFITEYFTKRELSSKVGVAHDRLRMAMASGKCVGWEWDLASGRDFWFGDLQTMFGVSSDTFSGQVEDFYRYLHADDRKHVSEAMTDARVNHKPYDAEFRVVRQDGTVRWVAARGTFYYARNGDPERMLGMAVDITERKQAEEGLKKSEEKFSKAFRESPIAVTVTSAQDHRYLDVNETFERLTGWRRDEVIGRTPFDLGLWVDPAKRVELVKQIRAEGTVRNMEILYRCKDGEQRVGLGSAETIEIGNEPCVLAVIADITERKQIQKQLHESEKQLSSIIASAMDAIIAVDEEQHIVLFNAAAEKMFRCPAGEAIGSEVHRFVPQRFASEHKTRMRLFGESSVTSRTITAPRTLWGVRADGEEFPIEASISHVEADGKKIFTVIIRDITERCRVDEALREGEQRLRLAVQAGRMYAYEWDAVADIEMRSPEALDILGHDQSLRGSRRELLTNVHPEDRAQLAADLAGVSPENPASQVRYRLLRPDGSVIWLEKRSRAFFDDRGKMQRVVGVVADITDREQAEQALRASEERYRHLVDSSNDWVWEVDADGVYTYAGPQCREILGYEPAEIIGKTPFDLMPPDESLRVATLFKAIAAERKPFRGLENTNLHKDGHLVVLETNGAPVIDEQGRFHGYRGMDRDITERKHAEMALRRSELKYRTVIEMTGTGYVVIDSQGRVLDANQEYVRLSGHGALREILGRSVIEWTAEGAKQRNAEAVAQCAKDGFIRNFVTEYVDGKGRVTFIEINGTVEGEGQSLRIVALCRDVTERKRAEEELQRQAQLMGQVHDAILTTDLAGFVTSWNAAATRVFGYSAEEALGKPVSFLYPEDQRSFLAEGILVPLKQKGWHQTEARVRSKSGREFPVHLSLALLKDAKGDVVGMVGSSVDITERKQAEHAIRESEQRFRLVANSAPVMIWMSGTDKLCNYFNQPWLEFTGRPFEAELGNGWTDGVHPEDLKRCLETYTQAFDRQESFQMQYRLRRSDGEYRWLSDIGVPRFNPDGSFAGYIGSCLDVTDHKLAEEALANMSRRLIEAHEEERTWIARELHDDINQRIALLAIELERWNQHLPKSAVDLHDHIDHARQRLSDIAKDVQALSHRLHSSKLEYLGIVAAANSFCKELSEQQKVQVEFKHTDIPRTIPKEIALCLFRVLQEALQNAVKHSGARRFNVDLRDTAEGLRLTVSDPGVGFDWQSAMNRQGLGLISMRERLQLVNGEFSIESEPGRGTTISARVPYRIEEHRRSVAG